MSIDLSLQARADHKPTTHFEGGQAWASCRCGWESRKYDAYHDYQMTQASKDGWAHQRQQESLAFNKMRGS